MRETPLQPTVLQSEKSVGLGNPQLTDLELAYLAGLWDGEGSFVLARTNGNRLRAMATIVNTNPLIVSTIKDSLQRLGIPYYLGTYSSKGKSKKMCYQFNVNRYHAVQLLCGLLIPHLKGKKAEAELVYDWVSRRIEKIASYVCTSVTDGYKPAAVRTKGPKHDEEDIAFLNRLAAIKSGSSET